MLGLGETRDELFDTLADLRDVGCDFLTLGQYLRPTPEHLPVVRYLPPEEFDELGRAARRLGFSQVASGPFVRSSYHARDGGDGVIRFVRMKEAQAMGWGRYFLLGDFGQQLDLNERAEEIARLEQRLQATRSRDSAVADELRRLTLENGQLKLYVASIYRLLVDKRLVTKEELEAVISAIDRQDGEEDGQLKGPLPGR